jgi:hypothetical protein
MVELVRYSPIQSVSDIWNQNWTEPDFFLFSNRLIYFFSQFDFLDLISFLDFVLIPKHVNDNSSSLFSLTSAGHSTSFNGGRSDEGGFVFVFLSFFMYVVVSLSSVIY